MTNGSVTLPQSEIQRLRSLIPRELTDTQIKSIEKLTDATEYKATPIIIQIPKEIMIGGQTKPFSIATLQEVWQGEQGLFVTDYLSDKTKTWESGEIRVFTSKCLAGSKNLNYKDQIALQESIGQGHEIDESMFFAMAFHYLKT